MPNLAPFGAIPVAERVVFDGNRVTGGGVTSGIDFALQIVARLYGPEVAPPALVARLTAAMAAYQARSAAAVRAAAERL